MYYSKYFEFHTTVRILKMIHTETSCLPFEFIQIPYSMAMHDLVNVLNEMKRMTVKNPHFKKKKNWYIQVGTLYYLNI